MSTPEEIEEALAQAGSKRGAARVLGIPESTLRNAMKRLHKEKNVTIPSQGMVVKKHSVTFDEDGGIKVQTIGTVAAPGDVWEIPTGYIIKGESVLLDPEGKLLTRWVKTREGEAGQLQDALLAAFAGWEGKASLVPAPEFINAEILTVYPLPDLHFGMFSWGKETGQDYDIKIAREIALASVAALVSQSRPSKRAVLLGVGDYFHQNDQKNVTPRSGHRLDVDGRWSKVYQAGAELLLEMVNLLLEKHDIVEVVMLPGNHDEDAATTLRVALSLFYRSNPRIEVYSEPGLAWYSRFGQTLLGAHHGHTMKPVQMAMMLATDRAVDWGQTLFRHFFFGHIHHETANEIGPVRVESFQTPASRDANAHQSGYRSGRSLSAITFHADHGEIGRHRVNIIRS